MGALNFVLGLTDELSAPARKAESALSSLEKQIKSEAAELSKLERSMRNINKGDVVDIAAAKSLTSQISAKKNSLSGLETKMVSVTKAESAATSQTMSFSESLAGAGEVLGPLALGLGAVATVVAGLVIGGAALALSASDFKGDMIDVYDKIGAVPGQGEKLYAQIDAIAKKLPIPAAKVHEQAEKLMAQGVTDAETLASTLEAAGDLQAAHLDEAASKLQAIVKKAATGDKLKLNAGQLKSAGVTLDEVTQSLVKITGKNAADLKHQLEKGTINAATGIKALNAAVSQKYGGLAAKNLLDLDVQAQKFKDNVSRLFADVKPDKFLAELGKIGALFDDQSASGKVMKAVITKTFDAIFDAGARVLPYVKEGFELLIITGLKVATHLKPLVGTLMKTFETKGEGIKLATVFKVIGGAVEFVVGGMLILSIAAMGVFRSIGAGYGLAVDAFTAIGDAASGVWDLFVEAEGKLEDSLVDVIVEVESWWDDLKGIFDGAGDLGTSFVDGLADGITGGIGKIVDAAKGLASAAVDTAKSALGIRSPSAVMAIVGDDTSEGFSKGVEASTPKAQRSLEKMVEPPSVPKLAPPALEPVGPALATATGRPSLALGGTNDNARPSPLAAVTPELARPSPLAAAAAPLAPEAPPPALAAAVAPSVNVEAPNVQPPAVPPPQVNVAQAAPVPSAKGGTPNVQVTINIEGAGKDAGQIVEMVEERLVAFFERTAGQLGGSEAA